MFLSVKLQCSAGSEATTTSRMLANEFVQAPVSHHEVVNHLLMMPKIEATKRTTGLSLIGFHVAEQMQSEGVCGIRKYFKADAADFFLRS